MYSPDSRGTVFYDTAGININNFEYGIYAGVEKSFFAEQLKLQVTLRTDKNENFNRLFSPAASLVWTPNDKDYLRVSFSSAIRNPTLNDQYLFLNVGRAILAGNLEGVDSLITVESLTEYFKQPRPNVLEYFDIASVQPEQVRTLEAGYRTTLFDNTFIDAGYYYSTYNNFLGFNIGVEGEFDALTGLPLRLQAYRYAANSVNTVTTQGLSAGINHYFAKYYMVSGNYSWNKLIKAADDDPIIPAFNTPEHKFNLGISGRDIDLDLGFFTLKKVGFKINYKWIEGFLFEGSPQFTGFIPTYDLMDVQANVILPKIKTTLKIGASNALNNRSFQTYGGPRIGRLGYISLVYEQGKK
ncbi:MAG: TonB-dependent receptor [Saprospiraceae bacterium]|nr:TonB-dependent receptor [Saprospiraceae bacterium]